MASKLELTETYPPRVQVDGHKSIKAYFKSLKIKSKLHMVFMVNDIENPFLPYWRHIADLINSPSTCILPNGEKYLSPKAQRTPDTNIYLEASEYTSNDKCAYQGTRDEECCYDGLGIFECLDIMDYGAEHKPLVFLINHTTRTAKCFQEVLNMLYENQHHEVQIVILTTEEDLNIPYIPEGSKDRAPRVLNLSSNLQFPPQAVVVMSEALDFANSD
ncbi:hypothetical protein S40288_11533 [Stachybotrys chartarum IBT 40288]|nr:hypothetical protein S40288_11533 [Stachybotrys chartarum IBT 40288]